MSHSARACVGTCNAGWRASLAQQAPQETPPRMGSPVWCEPCARGIETALRAMPQNLTALTLESQHGSIPQRERVSGTKPRPIHPKESFTFLSEDIFLVLTLWEEDVREQRRFSARRARGTQGRQVQEAAQFLLAHLEWLLADHPSDEAIAGFGHEITALHRRVRTATKADDAPLRKCEGVRCPKCLMKALVWEQHYDKSLTGYVLCQGCQNLMNEDEYHRWVEREARGTRKLVRRA